MMVFFTTVQGFASPCNNREVVSADLQPYKYNGKELDKMHGLNTCDYGARQYYSILGRWDRVDPLAEKYYPYSPYVYCANNPVNAIDPDGRTINILYYRDGKIYKYKFDGEIRGNEPNNAFLKDFLVAYKYNTDNGGGESMKAVATNLKIEVNLMQSKSGKSFYYYEYGEQKISWGSRKGLITSEGGFQSPATILEHEFTHALHHAMDGPSYRRRKETGLSKYKNAEEKKVITGAESKTAKANGESIRKDHLSDPNNVFQRFKTTSSGIIEEYYVTNNKGEETIILTK
jgi:RHS repeat-associated protein